MKLWVVLSRDQAPCVPPLIAMQLDGRRMIRLLRSICDILLLDRSAEWTKCALN